MIQPITRRYFALGGGVSASGFLSLHTLMIVHSDSGVGRGQAEMIASTNGVAKNLSVRLTEAPGGSATRTFTLWINGVASALTFTIGPAGLTGSDPTNTASYSEGDRLVVKATYTGSPVGVTNVFLQVDLDSDSPNASWIGGNWGQSTNNNISAFNGEFNAIADQVDRVIAFPGTITKMWMGNNTFGGFATALDLYIVKNGVTQNGTGGTVNTKTSLPAGTPAYSQASASFSLPVARGDFIRLLKTSNPNTNMCVGLRYEADANSVSIISARGGGDPGNSTPYYIPIQGSGATWGSSNAIPDHRVECGLTPIGLTWLIVRSNTGVGAAPNTRTFALLKQGIASGVTADMTAAVPIGEDVTHVAYYTAGQVIGPLMHTGVSAPTVSGTEYWGFALFGVGTSSGAAGLTGRDDCCPQQGCECRDGGVYGAAVGRTYAVAPDFPQPPWIPMASGGAMYLSAADEVPDEVW